MTEYWRACGSTLPKYSKQRIEDSQLSSQTNPERPRMPTANTSAVVKSHGLLPLGKCLQRTEGWRLHYEWHAPRHDVGLYNTLECLDKGSRSIESGICIFPFVTVVILRNDASDRRANMLVDLVDKEWPCQ
jgi:hypothetical protein